MNNLKKPGKRNLKNYWLQKHEQANKFEKLARDISKFIKESKK
jgi:hypothetical protein